MQNYYKTLNISEEASQDEIKKSYRKLAMKWHPDRNINDKKAEDKFKEIQKAYEILSDPKKRSEYDNSRIFGFGGTNHFNQSEENVNDFFKQHFSDIFNDHFSDFFRQRTFVQNIDITIGFWEAIKGCNKKFQLNVSDGNGIKTFDINLKIPEGSNSGDSFLIEVGGEKVQININVEEDLEFQRNNLDLYLQVSIPFYTAILGDKITFPHWDGDIEILIPEGMRNGQKLRIPNKGVTKGVFKGDLFLIVKIDTPSKITEKQKEILKEFKKSERRNNIFSDLKEYLKKIF